MRILIDVGEAAERFEEMIELASRGDEILICRNGSPVAALTYITKVEASMDAFLKLAGSHGHNIARLASKPGRRWREGGGHPASVAGE